MNKPFQGLAAAVGAAGLLCATAASAQSNSVVIYGLMDAAVRHVNNADANRASLTTMEDGIFTGSRLGFRGREELGNGMAALFTMEAGFDPSSGTSLQGSPAGDYGQIATPSRLFGREVHVGLRGASWGLTVGRQYTIGHTMTARFQPQGNPNNNALSIFSSHHVARQDNVLRVDARLGGVELAVAHTFGETADADANGTWAVGASYSTGPVWAGAYAQRMKNLADTETRKIVGLGASYKLLPALTLYGGTMRRTHETSPQENKVYTLALSYDITPAVNLSFAHLADDQSGSAVLDGSRKVSYVTASYRFSRRSDVYGVMDRNSVRGGYAKPAFMGTLGTQNAFTVGLRHRF
ncbi:porin [Azohydromonas aeria]|uniref:porin n=1 Tax=Azohydromonas aeria TaxID=2590212 RepID=UPI0012F715D5|nr:porin [Azohydromonas aeria]